MKPIKSNYDFTQIDWEKISLIGQKSMLNRNLFCVSWILHRFCNFKCSYCWPHGRTSKKDFRSFESIKKTLKTIKSQARERGFNSFAFSFSGGEPTIHPDFLDIQTLLANDHKFCDYQTVHMTTNLSKSIKWYEKYINITKPLSQTIITASYHKEHIKNIDYFRDKLLLLQDNEVSITINIVIPPNNFDLLWKDALFFYNAGLNVTLKPQSDPKASKVVDGYSKKQLDILKNGMPQRDNINLLVDDNQTSYAPQVMNVEMVDSEKNKWYLDQAERLNALNFNRFPSWECSSGYRSIVIREPGGIVKRSYSCIDKNLGTLDKGFSLHNSVEQCISESCVSSADNKIPKRKKGFKWPLWPDDKTF